MSHNNPVELVDSNDDYDYRKSPAEAALPSASSGRRLTAIELIDVTESDDASGVGGATATEFVDHFAVMTRRSFYNILGYRNAGDR